MGIGRDRRRWGRQIAGAIQAVSLREYSSLLVRDGDPSNVQGCTATIPKNEVRGGIWKSLV
jgi:hypothetical protein